MQFRLSAGGRVANTPNISGAAGLAVSRSLAVIGRVKKAPNSTPPSQAYEK